MNRQVLIKAGQVARMIVRGLPLTKVCGEMGMSYEGLIRITRCQEYLQIEERVRNAVVGKMDARLAKRAQMETEVEDAVPEALQVLLDNGERSETFVPLWRYSIVIPITSSAKQRVCLRRSRLHSLVSAVKLWLLRSKKRTSPTI